MDRKAIEEELFKEKDLKYKEFLERLLPTLSKDQIIGVRMAKVRKIAKEVLPVVEPLELTKEELYFLETKNVLAVIINQIKDDKACIQAIDPFLRHIDNWSTCDLLRPKIFKKKKDLLYPWIVQKFDLEDEYTLRLAVGFLHTYFLEKDFDPTHFDLILSITNEDYYVQMMIAWYMAEALVKQYDKAIQMIEKKKLNKWVHNKSIQKARESFRMTEDKKEYLRSLRIK